MGPMWTDPDRSGPTYGPIRTHKDIRTLSVVTLNGDQYQTVRNKLNKNIMGATRIYPDRFGPIRTDPDRSGPVRTRPVVRTHSEPVRIHSGPVRIHSGPVRTFLSFGNP